MRHWMHWRNLELAGVLIVGVPDGPLPCYHSVVASQDMSFAYACGRACVCVRVFVWWLRGGGDGEGFSRIFRFEVLIYI